MMARTVLYVGDDFPGGIVESAAFFSSQSLLDADVVLFEPPQGTRSHETYQGKYSLNDHDSFRFRNACTHWRGEIAEFLAAGKTLIVFLAAYEDFFVDTGQRSYSGTGRNQKTTRHVALYDNYRFLPAALAGITPKGGKAIVATSSLGVIADYWQTYRQDLEYRLYFDDSSFTPLLHTRTGKKTVAGFKSVGAGTLVLLPPVHWDWDDFVTTDEYGREAWTDEGEQFGRFLLDVILSIDSAARAQGDRTPPPQWVETPEYALVAEQRAREEVAAVTAQIETLKEVAATKRDEAADASQLKALLYGTGKELENAVIRALQVLGFEAENYDEGESEFDIVFMSEEGRFLGEAEGKDSKPVNIDKLRQLEMNVQEDFARDGVHEYAVGVLFGNACRLTPPPERPEQQFTDKCAKAAQRSGVVLVRTSDLFAAARYVAEHPRTKSYARSVRKAMAASKGRVLDVPVPPG